MKLLTIAVPCYNSEAYMHKCIDSLLTGGEDVEILIVDDGSTKDKTAEIADEYEKNHPGIVRAIHQENKGHGGAVNTGIANATGLYFKVVDSDDWVDSEAYRKILDVLKELTYSGSGVDAVFSNYVYEKEGQRKKRVMRYSRYFPEDRVFEWKDAKPLSIGKYVLMHSIIYRTSLLREVNLELPEHTFYVDNLYAFIPMAAVKKMYYIDVNFYRYFIGRADQSVNETVMSGRIDQQLRVNGMMIDFMAEKGHKLKGNQWKFVIHSLSIIMSVSSILLIRIGTPEAMEKKKNLWKYLKKADAGAYHYIRLGLMGMTLNLPGHSGQKLSVMMYKIAQKIYGFN